MNIKTSLPVILLGCLLSGSLIVAPDFDIPNNLKGMPVQYQGRAMPFSSFAREIILEITGKQHWEGEEPTKTVLTWLAFPEIASSTKLIKVNYDPLREVAHLDANRRKYSFNELVGNRHLRSMGQEAAHLKQNDEKPTREQSEAEKVVGRIGAMWAVLTHQIPGFIPDPHNPNAKWTPLADTTAIVDSVSTGIQMAVAGVTQSLQSGDLGKLAELGAHLNRLVKQRWNPTREQLSQVELESTYNRLRLIYWGRVFYVIALLLLLFSIVNWGKYLIPTSRVLIALGLVAHVAGLVMRWQIGGRAPWSNLYESLVALTALIVLLGLMFTNKKLRGPILGGVAFAGFMSLYIADNAGLSPAVDTLLPALQSYWLTIHVIVILAGYAAAALAMILGHISLGIEAFKKSDRPLFISSVNTVYRAVQIAMLLLFAGTILGGVWAHEAWGRYWGWDPKETWALISWFGYLGVAHARFAGWLKPRGLAMAAIGVFPLILMTYYGVNYLLSGLHSYAGGDSAAIPPALIGFLALETFILIAAGRGWHMKLTPNPAGFSTNGHKKVPPAQKRQAAKKQPKPEKVED